MCLYGHDHVIHGCYLFYTHHLTHAHYKVYTMQLGHIFYSTNINPKQAMSHYIPCRYCFEVCLFEICLT